MEIREGIYLDGRWEPSTGDATFTVINPYTEEPFGRATIGNERDVDAAVLSARRALTEGPWRTTPLDERIAIVKRIQEGLVARTDQLARLSTSSMGVPYAATRGHYNTFELIDSYIDMARRVRWEYLRMDNTGDTLIARRPVGVVAGIIPWNAPVRGEAGKVIPALLAGCSIVLKPAPETPFAGAILAEICSEAGVPPGVVNLVPGDASTGDLLVRHPLVRKVAFTGSSATGSKIWAATADRFARLQLELGGKSAAILLADADLATAVPWLSGGVFALGGQQCTATSRVLAPRSRYDEVVEAMAAAAGSYVMGDPLDPATTLGPLVAERQRTRVLGYIDIGRSEGAKLITGGGRPGGQPRGWFVEPTVFADVESGMRIAQEEIFGPVVSIIPYESEADAIRIANDSEYGLGGAVHSADQAHALEVARQVDSGYVAVNRYGIPSSAPFGGVKRSGIGRIQGYECYDSFLEYLSYPVTHELAQELAKTVPLG
jgi:aldehyde dehydrogenase (NAD+)